MSRREQSRLVDALPDLVSAILGKVASLVGFRAGSDPGLFPLRALL